MFSHLLHLHVQIHYLLNEEGGDAVVVASSTGKQLKASYCRRIFIPRASWGPEHENQEDLGTQDLNA